MLVSCLAHYGLYHTQYADINKQPVRHEVKVLWQILDLIVSECVCVPMQHSAELFCLSSLPPPPTPHKWLALQMFSKKKKSDCALLYNNEKLICSSFQLMIPMKSS